MSCCVCGFGNFASPLWSCSLSSPPSPFSTSLFHLSYSFSQFSFPFLPFFSRPVSNFSIFSLCPFCPVFNFFSLPSLYPRVLFHSSCSPHHHSDSFLFCFTLVHGQVAEQLAYYVHVSETVITEETFDAGRAVLAQCGADPPGVERDNPFACPLVCPQPLQGKEHQGQLHRQHVPVPRQAHRWAPVGETVHCQMTQQKGRSSKNTGMTLVCFRGSHLHSTK